ncbi:MAG: radical SAM protein [Planctomycetota bacterium]
MTTVLDDPFTSIEKRALAECRPTRAMLELTYRCNFRCVMCYLVEFRSPGELSLAEYESVLDQLAELGCLSLTLTGGEPLVRKDFFEIAEAARRRRFALRIFSNGSLIDAACADRLAALQPLSTEISIYGASDATYAAVTGKGLRVATSMQAVRLLRERGLTVVVKMPVIQQNLSDVDAIHEFALEVGARFLANPNITPKDNGDFSPLAHALSDTQIIEYYRQRVPRIPDRVRDPDGLMCNTGRNSLIISPMGDVFPCVQVKKSVGNVRERRIEDIWRGGVLLDELRQLRVRDYPRQCGTSSCGTSSCGSQCAGIAKMATGSFTGGDPLAARQERLRAEAHR